MNKAGVKKRIPVVAVLLIILLGIFLRIMAGNTVISRLGDDYIDQETGVPYLTEMDSYYHLRMTRDIQNFGHAGETLKDGEPWDSLSYAPLGRSAADYSPLMAYIAVFSTKILSFIKDISLEKTVYWQGTFLSVLVALPVFIIGYRMQGMIAAVIAGVLSVLNYGYFLHTVPGFYDTDTVLSWACAFFFCFAILLAESREKKKRIIYSILFFISFLILIISWNAYTLFLGIIAISLVIYSILSVKEEKMELREKLTGPCLSLILIVVGILILDRDFFLNLASQFMAVFAGGSTGLFPDAYVSVSEMRKPSLIAGGLSGLFQMKVLSGSNIGVINAVGGSVACIMALVMWVMLVRGLIKGERRFDHVLLVVWYFLTAILAFRSWRFIMLFAVPTAILAGVLVGKICALMKDRKMMDWQVYAGMLILLAIFPTLYGAYRSVGDSQPHVNRYLAEPLENIRSRTDSDTMIASWWDYGYFYEEKTGRRIIFDGGSQNGMRIYWIGKAFASGDEKLSRNIIRMLSGAGDSATEKMIASFGESRETLALMTELLSLDREAAEKRLSDKGITSGEAAEIAELLFPDPDEDVLLIITPDMVRIAQWFASFGFYGEDTISEDDYAMVIDNAEYKSENGKAGWRFAMDNKPVDLIIEEKNEIYTAHTETPGKGGEPVSIDRMIIMENGMSTEYSGDGAVSINASSEGGKGWTVFVNKDTETPFITVVTTPLFDSVFGRLYFRGGERMEYFGMSDLTGGSAAIFEVK